MTKKILVFFFAMVLVLSISSAVFAQEVTPEPEPLACSGEQVAGTLVDFNSETNTATIDTGEGEGLCTVSFKNDYGHPVTTLLGNYFGSFNMGSFSDTLQATEVCLVEVLDESTGELSYQLAEGEGCLGTLAKVTGQNEDGSFQFVTGDGEEVSLTSEEVGENASALSGALGNLMVEWGLNEDGSVTDAGDEIAQYHDDGFGFGVIVKIYGMALASMESCAAEEVPTEEVTPTDEGTPVDETSCGLKVEDLFQALKDGTSVGQLFKLYGKPSMLGVGHVRQNSAAGEETATGAEGALGNGNSAASGVCNARSHGGNANAKGKGNAECGDPTDVQIDQTEDQQKTNHGKPNKDKNKNNNKGN